MIIYAPHKASHKTNQVRKEMIELGAPKIRAVKQGEDYIAIEGSHRIAVAFEQESTDPTVVLEIVGSDEIVEHDFNDFDSPCTAQNIVEWLKSDNKGEEYEGMEWLIPYLFREESVSFA